MRHKFFLVIACCLLTVSGYSQTKDTQLNKFYASILAHTTAITPLATVLRVDIGPYGAIKDFKISDGAARSFSTPLLDQKDYLDWQSLKLYVKKNKLRNVSILIPWYVTLGSEDQTNYGNGRNFMLFASRDFVGKAIILPPQEIYIHSEY